MASLEEYVAALDARRRTDVLALHELVTSTAPELEHTMALGVPSYGPYRYRYASGREGEHAVVQVRATAAGVSVHVAATTPDGRWLPEVHAAELRPATVGRSCIRIRRLEQVSEHALRTVLREAVQLGGAAAV